jgi:hypothetical protein
MLSRIQNLLATIVTIIVVSGCAVGSGPSEIPSNLLDGAHTHKFTHNAPTICRYNCIDRVSTYTGQWVNNRPKGQGEVIGNDGLTCRGEFGIQRPNTSLPDPTHSDTVLLLQEGGEEKAAKDNYIWAKGEVFHNGKPWFTGTFRNNFYFGEGCMPFGEDTWTSDISGALMSGTVKVDFDRRSAKYSSTMAVGPCKIIRKDGAIFEGSCDAPSEYQIKKGEIGLMSMKELLSRDAFFLAAAGTFTEPNGKRLSGSESEQKIAQYKQYILAKQREDKALAAEAARENQRQRIAKVEEDARQSAANWQGVLAIAGATAGNYAVIQGQQQAAAKLGNNILADSQRAADTARENNERRAREARQQQAGQQAAGAALPLAQLRSIPSSTKITTVASSAANLPTTPTPVADRQAAAPQYQSPAGQRQQPVQTPAVSENDKIYFAYALQQSDHSVPFCSTEGPGDTHGPLAKIAPLPDTPANMPWDLMTPQPVTKAQCSDWLRQCNARQAGSLCH